MKKTTIKNRIRKIATTITLLAALFVTSATTALADYNVKPTSVSAATTAITVSVGSEFELRAYASPGYAEDDYIQWTIVSGKKYVAFEDNDRTGDEMEFIAKKAGTAKIRCSIPGTSSSVTYTVTVNGKNTAKIKAVGTTARTVYLGQEFELKVKKTSKLSDKYLKWTISDKSVVSFEDYDRTGDDMDFIAVGSGTTKITCKNKKTKQTITFTVTVQ